MCISNVCSCVSRKEIDWSKPLVGIRTGVEVEHVGKAQGDEHIIRFTLPGESRTSLAVVDKYGTRSYDNQPMIKNKDKVLKFATIAVEVWRSKNGAFSTRPWKPGNLPFEGQTSCGQHPIKVTWSE